MSRRKQAKPRSVKGKKLFILNSGVETRTKISSQNCVLVLSRAPSKRCAVCSGGKSRWAHVYCGSTNCCRKAGRGERGVWFVRPRTVSDGRVVVRQQLPQSCWLIVFNCFQLAATLSGVERWYSGVSCCRQRGVVLSGQLVVTHLVNGPM